MIELSQNTEALANRIADAEGLSVDEAVRLALEAREMNCNKAEAQRTTDLPPVIVAAPYAAIERAVRAMAALPDLDPRSSQEIMDDLNSL